MTGPAPKMPVKVVPGAGTVAASLFLVWRIWASRRRRPIGEAGGELAAGPGGRA